MEFAYNSCVNTTTGLTHNKVRMNLFPRLDRVISDYRHTQGHQRLSRDHLDIVTSRPTIKGMRMGWFDGNTPS